MTIMALAGRMVINGDTAKSPLIPEDGPGLGNIVMSLFIEGLTMFDTMSHCLFDSQEHTRASPNLIRELERLYLLAFF